MKRRGEEEGVDDRRERKRTSGSAGRGDRGRGLVSGLSGVWVCELVNFCKFGFEKRDVLSLICQQDIELSFGLLGASLRWFQSFPLQLISACAKKWMEGDIIPVIFKRK